MLGYRQRISTKIGTDLSKKSIGFSTSPDGGVYPFIFFFKK